MPFGLVHISVPLKKVMENMESNFNRVETQREINTNGLD